VQEMTICSRSPRHSVLRAKPNASPKKEAGFAGDAPRQSALSRFFASQHTASLPEDRVQASLADLADSACRSLHQTSQKHNPCARQLLEGWPQADRQETLTWMAQAFDVMNFPEGFFFDTALLLDRYYAGLPKEDQTIEESQRTLLAAVCMAIKTGSTADNQVPLRQVVTHLGHDEVPFEDVTAAELGILRKLRFDVGTPTPRDFLQALSVRLKSKPVECQSLAEFLLQLSLADPALHYRYPHALLAAAALLLALSCAGANSTTHAIVLEDLVLCEDLDSSMLAQCSRELHSLWTLSCSQEQNMYIYCLRLKFAKGSFHGVSLLRPPLTALLLPEAPRQGFREIWRRSATQAQPTAEATLAQDEIEEAAQVVQQSLDGDKPQSRRTLETCGLGECEARTSLRDSSSWVASLAARLRRLADQSWKVRCILAGHGWYRDHFRRPPDRERLQRDLLRAKGNRSSLCMVTDRLAVERRPRAASCGQRLCRPSAALTGVLVQSP
ncbi:unnamed protein product, partial [Effrenium voratum]